MIKKYTGREITTNVTNTGELQEKKFVTVDDLVDWIKENQEHISAQDFDAIVINPGKLLDALDNAVLAEKVNK